MKFRFQRKYLCIPYWLFLVLFVVVPIFFIVFYAFTDGSGRFTWDAFVEFFTTNNKLNVLVQSLLFSTLNTILCLLIGYPISYLLANKKYNTKYVLVLLFVMPMWINFVLRTAATRDILFAIGITGGAHPYLATLIGMVYNYLPFVILPLYSTMLKLDRSQMEAAADLGASPVRVFISNVIPQSLPGIISAITMTLMPVMSSYVISDALSEGNITLIGNSIYLSFANSQWNNGSFTAFLLLILVLLTMWNTNGRKSEEVRGGLW